MPTRISAGVGDHPCFLFIHNYIPIDCKITNFFSYILVIYIGAMNLFPRQVTG